MKLVKMVALTVGAWAAITVAVPTQAQITYYSDRPAFTAANTNLSTEDFEDATPAVFVNGPQDRFTNNAAFQLGDILTFVRISDVLPV